MRVFVEFGPMIRTTDAEKMKGEISKLKAAGGGDTPEMCLSGLQVHKLIVMFYNFNWKLAVHQFIGQLIYWHRFP